MMMRRPRRREGAGRGWFVKDREMRVSEEGGKLAWLNTRGEVEESVIGELRRRVV
jgi:hypothetical protein